MKIIFEENDLVKRDIVLRSEITENGFKGGILATIVGLKTDKPDTYKGLCIFAYTVNGDEKHWYGRKFGDVVVDKTFFDLLSGKEKREIVIGDEDMPGAFLNKLWLRMTDKEPNGAKIELPF